jgi:hypothetical protein
LVPDVPPLVLSGNTCYEPALCSDGERWLVVWRATVWGQQDVYGTFVEAGGHVTHPGGFRLTATAQGEFFPAVVFGAEQYLIAWYASRPLFNSEIIGNRVARGGTLLDTANYYSNLVGADAKPALTFDGDNYFVTWVYRQGADYAICCLRVDMAGVALDSPPVFVQESSSYYDNPAVAFNGEHHYLVWAEQSGGNWHVRGARVATNATVLDTFLLVADERQGLVPTLAAGPAGEMLMVYPARVDSINGHPAGVTRIKGVLSPYGGVAEETPARPGPATLRATPVPFRREVRFEAVPGGVVTIRDSAGRLVRVLATGAVSWNGTDELGRPTPRGVYFAGLEPSPGRAARCKLVKLE